MNDSYYSIGAMGFYMGQDWTWNQGDWVGIDVARHAKSEKCKNPK